MKSVLPIDSHLDHVLQLLQSQKPLILTASPGSGKTTRFPAALLEQNIKNKISKKIIVIVPKRISAVAAADRIASENNWTLGHEVGYQVRFESRMTDQTQLLFMTEGLFLQRLNDPEFWLGIHTLILDEFHERSSQIDLILGLAYEKYILDTNFNLVIMSATLHVDELKQYLGDCHNYDIDHKPYPLEIIYHEKTQKLKCDDDFHKDLLHVLQNTFKKTKKDILIFLPGLGEILKFKKTIENLFHTETAIDILHGSVSLDEQKRIITVKNHRRIILSTNVAESSVTVQGVDCVIDSGLEKVKIFETKIGFSGLKLSRISQFSATQRAGRAAREKEGICYRFWHSVDERSMKKQSEPDILSTNLIYEILKLKQLGIDNIHSFSWLTKPSSIQINTAISKLKRWNLLDTHENLTDLGKRISRSSVSAELAVLHESLKNQYPHLASVLVTRLDQGQFEKQIEEAQKLNESDFHVLTDESRFSFQEKKLYQQLRPTAKSQTESLDQFLNDVIRSYIQNFPEKVIFKKSKTTGVSLNGRGIVISNQSTSTASDYLIALSGKENHLDSTTITASIGFDKALAQKLFQDFSETKVSIEFDSLKKTFYKLEQKVFGSLVIADYGKVPIKQNELNQIWKSEFIKNPTVFFELHHQYENLSNKINFLIKKSSQLKLSEQQTHQLLNWKTVISETILEYYSQFEEFLNCDLFYLIHQGFDDNLNGFLQALPDSIKAPNSKTIKVNYTDEKAPLISLKIQDAFGWNKTPQLASPINMPFTLELLAPNMRPAQITNQLGLFWKNSYLDVRKELKARYPKHPWPEDPSCFLEDEKTN